MSSRRCLTARATSRGKSDIKYKHIAHRIDGRMEVGHLCSVYSGLHGSCQSANSGHLREGCKVSLHGVGNCSPLDTEGNGCLMDRQGENRRLDGAPKCQRQDTTRCTCLEVIEGLILHILTASNGPPQFSRAFCAFFKFESTLCAVSAFPS